MLLLLGIMSGGLIYGYIMYIAGAPVDVLQSNGIFANRNRIIFELGANVEGVRFQEADLGHLPGTRGDGRVGQTQSAGGGVGCDATRNNVWFSDGGSVFVVVLQCF